jgi:site-specific recombinase XerD
MTNEELYQLYDSDLVLRLHNTKDLSDTRKMVTRFLQHLNGFPPSPELAKSFLAQFTDRKPRTVARYAKMIKSFMKWYGEPMDDFRIKIPRSLPPYTEDGDIEKLFTTIENKKTHKGCVTRDALMVELALKTGMRRAELANLAPADIHGDFLMVRHGKGDKDRIIPLSPSIATRLHNFVQNMTPSEKVFKLRAPCISNKIRQFAKKAGLSDFHTHTLRHKFACDLLEKGANIKVVQALLGHENLATTEVYLSIVNQSLHDAVNLLEKPKHHRRPQPINEIELRAVLPSSVAGPLLDSQGFERHWARYQGDNNGKS